jgi:hypothetical protein
VTCNKNFDVQHVQHSSRSLQPKVYRAYRLQSQIRYTCPTVYSTLPREIVTTSTRNLETRKHFFTFMGILRFLEGLLSYLRQYPVEEHGHQNDIATEQNLSTYLTDIINASAVPSLHIWCQYLAQSHLLFIFDYDDCSYISNKI